MRRQYSIGALSLFALISLVYSKCVPNPNKVWYLTHCDNNFKGPIEVQSVEASQHGKSVEQNGGLDLGQVLNMTFKIKYNYNKPELKNPRYDFAPYQYTDDDGPCTWYQIDIGGATEDIDGCELQKNNCHHRNHPETSVVVVDFPKMLEDYSDVLSYLDTTTNPYYAFEATHRDGSTKLNCIRIQAKLIKSAGK